MKYTINLDHSGEGGSAEFYNIKENKSLGFKQFRNKRYAIIAYNKQKLLSKLSLAPKVYGKVCQLPIPFSDIKTNWGFITERAKVVNEKTMGRKLKDIQKLVENIEQKTGLKFWDCHYYNIGYIKRKNKLKLVCIDTGKESFDCECNAWGNNTPGPKCDACNQFICDCLIY